MRMRAIDLNTFVDVDRIIAVSARPYSDVEDGKYSVIQLDTGEKIYSVKSPAEIVAIYNEPLSVSVSQPRCINCEGSGFYPHKVCGICQGTGYDARVHEGTYP